MQDSGSVSFISIIVPIITALGTLIPVLVATFTNRRTVINKLDLVIRDVSRLTMHDENLPLEERISAGDRYLSAGGNGSSKVYHQTLVDQYKEELKEKGFSGSSNSA
jgi:hypothetical protein